MRPAYVLEDGAPAPVELVQVGHVGGKAVAVGRAPHAAVLAGALQEEQVEARVDVHHRLHSRVRRQCACDASCNVSRLDKLNPGSTHHDCSPCAVSEQAPWVG